MSDVDGESGWGAWNALVGGGETDLEGEGEF